MSLLRLITWQYLRRHKFRAVLTLAGIAIGVAVFVGMHAANQSVLYSFTRTVDQIAGKTQLQVSAGEAGFDEEVLERVQAHPGVAAAAPVIEAMVASGLPGQGNMLILAVDMTGDRSLRDYNFDSGDDAVIDDPLVFLAQPDSLLVSKEFAERNKLSPNSRLTFSTMEGKKDFTVRGIMKSGGLAQAFGSSLAIMDIYAAQKMFGRGRHFDRIDLMVTDGTPVEQVRRELKQKLGPLYFVDPPSARGQQFENLTKVYKTTSTLTSLFALFIGMFIIYNTFAIAVMQRRKEIGILRSLGATRGQVRNLFLLESAMAGLVGSALGVLGGLVMAKLLSGYLSTMFNQLYGIAQRTEEVARDPVLLLSAMGLGVLTSVLAGWLPARQAAQIDPVQALQKGKHQLLGAGENRMRRTLALVAAVVSVACLLGQSSRPVFYFGYVTMLVTAVLLAPSLALWLAQAVRPLFRLVWPVEGTLAVDSLIQAPRRTSGTVAALMLSLAMVVSIAGLAQSSFRSIEGWMNTALNPDLFVAPGQDFVNRTYRFPESLADQLAATPGVAEVQRVWMMRVPFRDAIVLLFSAEVESLGRRSKLRVVEGDPRTVYAECAAGKGVLISENFMNIYGVHAGETIALPGPAGMVAARVLGVIEDYSDQQGSVVFDRALMKKIWKDSTVNVVRIYATPGTDVKALRDEINRRFESQTKLYVMTNAEIRSFIVTITNQWLGITYVQIFVAVIVAMLGIVNSLIVSITDRRRELGVLQAVGGLRMQIRRTVWLEAVAIGVIGLALGLALGAVNLVYSLELGRRDMGGFHLAYLFPFGIAAALVPVILATAWISSLGPAESAVRASLVESLEYE